MSKRKSAAGRSKLAWLGLGAAWVILVALMLMPSSSVSQTNPYSSPYIILNGEFVDALNKLKGSSVTYGDQQEPLLKEIALTNQYLVKTNLTMVKQNERIIQLLEEINRKGQPQGR
ncbi:MAG: hypothetical protein A2Y80_01665 [Deltaproteobacteria bacterium RBG_13_58_19]|nr:MAG: hypothetical protein A2Y80_01665 [Deltaproteobacteria bacterium RBG_13_58_19]